MRILLISNGFPPRHWAGTETYTAGIAHELTRRGHEIYVLCIGDWDTGADYFNGYSDDFVEGVRIRRLNLNWWKAPDPSGFLYNNPVVADFLSGYLAEIRPDLVHVTSCETLSASVIGAAKNAGLPVVLSLTDFWFLCPRISLLHSSSELCDGRTTAWDCLRCQMRETRAYRLPSQLLPEGVVSLLLTEASRHKAVTRMRGFRGLAQDITGRKRFLRESLGCADRRITASEFVRSVFRANGIHDEILVRPYGHDLGWLNGFNGKAPADKLRVGYIGQISEQKGVHLLLQAARSLDGLLGERVTFSVYGNVDKIPAYGAQLRSLVNGTPSIQFCGTYAHEDSARVFANLDVLVVPSVWYDFPLIIHEAFATGTPVIATNLGGMAETVQPEQNGLLFERGDVQGLARQLRRLTVEPGLLERLRAGITPVKTIAAEMDELEALYQALQPIAE